MAGNYLQTTQNAVWIPEVIANEAIGALSSYLNLGRTVSKDSDLTPVRQGQVVSIPKRGAVSANAKSQGGTTTKQKPSATEVTVTIDQHYEVTIGEEDFTRALQIGSSLPGYVEDGVIALAEKIETDLTNLFSSFSNIDAGGSAGDAQKGVIDARKVLVTNKVPQLAPKFGYISPRFYARLLKESAFLDPKVLTGERALTEGAVGRITGIDIFEGQLTPTAGSPAWDQNFFYTRNALVLASRPLELPGSSLGVESANVNSDAGIALRVLRYFDTAELAVVYTLDVLYGVAVNDIRQGVVLESQ